MQVAMEESVVERWEKMGGDERPLVLETKKHVALLKRTLMVPSYLLLLHYLHPLLFLLLLP